MGQPSTPLKQVFTLIMEPELGWTLLKGNDQALFFFFYNIIFHFLKLGCGVVMNPKDVDEFCGEKNK